MGRVAWPPTPPRRPHRPPRLGAVASTSIPHSFANSRPTAAYRRACSRRWRKKKSSASGLFQITNATARDWGLSPEDRFDAIKSATAAADILARRADKVGPERAVGMHYGGPGTPWETPVGSSGLSPASYSADVFARARKYAPAAGEVGFAPPGFTDQGTAPPPPDHYDTRYQMRAPDGSVSTQVIRTDRPISTQELANHVAGQG